MNLVPHKTRVVARFVALLQVPGGDKAVADIVTTYGHRYKVKLDARHGDTLHSAAILHDLALELREPLQILWTLDEHGVVTALAPHIITTPKELQ